MVPRLIPIKDTKLERADFITLQLLDVCNRGKGESNVYNFLSLQFYVSFCPRGFKQGHAEFIQTREAQTNLPRRQLFLM